MDDTFSKFAETTKMINIVANVKESTGCKAMLHFTLDLTKHNVSPMNEAL